MNKLIVFTGGGTAGHVYPGLSVAESLQAKDSEIRILWIGSDKGMEKPIVEGAGIEFIGIPSGKLRRYFSLKNVTDIFRIAAGFFKAGALMNKYKPDLIFSKGGFVSVPPVAAAGFRKIPVITHESDVTPGLATRINKRFSDDILVSYAGTANYFPGYNVIVSGNPVRAAIFNADSANGRRLSGAGKRKIIFVIGGSQGALQVNHLVEELLPWLTENFFVIHQTGKHPYDGETGAFYRRMEYIGDELPDLMAAADLIISRAGASTLWETAALGKPSILIPLGTGASRGDQSRNAESFREAGASVVLEGAVTAEQLKNEIDRLMSNDTMRDHMGRAALKIVNGSPADFIAEHIIKRLR